MKELGKVAALGSFGGLLVWLSGMWIGRSVHLNVWADPIVSIVLGGGASVVFVFLIANTDRTDRVRLLALALLSGFFWEPVWEASRALVDRHSEAGLAGEAIEATERALSSAIALAAAQGHKRIELSVQLANDIERSVSLSRQLDSLSALSALKPLAEGIAEVTRDLPSEFREQSLAATNFVRLTSARSVLQETPKMEIEIERLRQSAERYRQLYAESNDLLHALVEQRYQKAISGVNTSITSRLTACQPRSRVPSKLAEDEIPDPTETRPLEIDVPLDVRQEAENKFAWFTIAVPVAGTFSIEARSGSADLFAALYSRATLRRVAQNDDSNDGQNSKIVGWLEAGEYLLHLSDYFGKPLSALTVRLQALPTPPEDE